MSVPSTFRHLLDVPGARETYRYAGDAFSAKVPTKSSPEAFLPLQAADLLAWQYRTYRRRQDQRQGTRLDWDSLLQTPLSVLDCDRNGLIEWLNQMSDAVKEEILAGAKAPEVGD
jgi:hypothetical protein